MDPISIAMTAGAVVHTAWKLANSLYSFASGVAAADEAMHAMMGELDSLRNATTTIQTCLRHPELRKKLETEEKLHRDDLFRSIDRTLRSAQETLDEFQQILDGSVIGESFSNPIRKTLFHLSLKFNAPEIISYRAKISFHLRTLQVYMQSITVYATIQSPNIVISKLEPKLDVLIDMVADLSPEQLGSANIAIPEVERERMIETAQQLKVDSDRVIFSAHSAASRASASGHGSGSGNSTNGRGQRLLRSPGGVSDWKSDSAPEIGRESTIAEESEVETDSEEESAQEFFKAVLEEGDLRYRAGNIEDAANFYRQAFETAEQTSLRAKLSGQYNDASLKLAHIFQQQKKLPEAKAILLDLLSDSASVSSHLAEQLVDASYLLAQIHLELKELNDAEKYCNKAMHARRKVDKTSGAYKESIGLLVKIYDEKGDKVKAITYRRLMDQLSERLLTPPPTPSPVSLEHRRQADSVTTISALTDKEIPLLPKPSRPLSSPPSSNNPGRSVEDIYLDREHPLVSRYRKGSRHGAFEWTITSPGEEQNLMLPQILERNSERVIYRAIEALSSSSDLFTRPMQSVRSKKFNPIITLRSRIYSGHLEVVWLLLYKLNHVKAEWEKRSHISRSSKRTEFLTKIDPNYRSEHKLSLLEDACSSVVKGRTKHDIVDLLLHYGANPNPQNSPFVPLAYATLHGNQNLAEILLAHHADPDVRLPSKDGSSEHIYNGKVMINDTVLIAAADLNLPKLLEALLFHNAQVDLTSSKGTPLCVAAEKGYLEIVKMLLHCGADVNTIRLIDNATPLCLAANNGHSAVVSTLLNHGANVEHEVEPGYTAIAYAYQNSHTAIVKILRERGAKV